jgi:hypothetical protein
LLAAHVVDAFANWAGTDPDRLLVGGTVTTTAGMPEHQVVTLSPNIDLLATNVASGNESFELKVDGKLIYKIEYRRDTVDGYTYMYAVETLGDGVTRNFDSGGNVYLNFAHTNSSMTVSGSASGITNVANTADQDYWSFRIGSVVARSPDIAVYPAGDMFEGGGWDTPDGSGGFTLVRNGPLEKATTVYFRTSGAAIQRSPFSPGPDYLLTGEHVTFGSVKFEPYQQFAYITAVPFDDTDPEWLERATLTLKDGNGYDLDPYDKQATIFLYDNDGGPGDPWWYEPPEESPPPGPDPDGERPDFTTNVTLGGKGGDDAGNTDPGDEPPDEDGSGDGGTDGETRSVFVPLNDDFDEQNKDAQGNLIPDSLPDATAGDRLLPADDEVLYGGITFSSDTANQSGKWVLNFSDEQIAVWAKGDAVGSPNEYRKIQPGELFTATTLPVSLSLAVEALVPSHTLDDVHLMARLVPDGGGTVVSDTILMTLYGTRLIKIDPTDGSTEEIDEPELSAPSPTINLTGTTLSNLRVSADKMTVLGDLHLTGTLDDAASDLIPGDPGKISSLPLFVNGTTTPVATIAASVSKSSGGASPLKPFDFCATFDSTITVELQPGWNSFSLAAENVYGFAGSAEFSAEVIVERQPDVVDLDVQFNATPSSSSVDTLTATIRRNGEPWQTEQLIETGADTRNFSNAAGTFVIELAALPAYDPAQPDAIQATVTHHEFGILAAVMGLGEIDPATGQSANQSGVFGGQRAAQPDIPIDVNLDRHTVSLGEITNVTATGPGSFNPFLMKVEGPNELRGVLDNISIGEGSYALAEYEGGNFLAILGADKPSPFLVLPHNLLDTSNVDLGIRERRDGALNVLKGFGAGLGDTAVGMWDGVAFLGEAVWNGVKNNNPVAITYRWITTGTPFTTSEQKAFSFGWQALQQMWTIVDKIVHDEQDAVQAVLDGDVEELKLFGEKYLRAVQYSVEILQTVAKAADDAFLNLDEYDLGRLYGRVVGEVLVALGTAGAGTLLKSTVAINAIAKLKTVAYISKFPGLVTALEGCASLLLVVRTGAKGSRILEELLLIEEKVRKALGAGATEFEILEAVIQRTAAKASKYDAALSLFTSGKMRRMYELAAGDATKVPKVSELLELMAGRLNGAGLQTHHTVPIQWAKKLLPGITQAELDEMPGILLSQVDHGTFGSGTGGFHQLLQARLPSSTTNTQTILDALESTYNDFGTPEVWTAAKAWLHIKGL